MKIIKPSTIAGVMELIPSEQLIFEEIKDTIEETFKKYQFIPIDTPLIEKNEILFAKGGGETEKQIFEIASDTKDMSLRFDLTVPLARYVSEHFQMLNFPFKRYHIGKVYRGERNQKGRYREFYQCDIDIIGHDKLSIFNDAIPPAAIYEVFKKLDMPEVTFRINNRKLLKGFFKDIGLDDSDKVLRLIDKKDKIGIDKVEAELVSLVGEDKAKRIIDFINSPYENESLLDHFESFDGSDEFKEGLEELRRVYEYMIKFGIDSNNIKIDPSITRGLDYYTSTVYETFINGYESIGSISSGGRYENLATNFSKNKLPGVGMSIGLTRLFFQLKELGLIKNEDVNLSKVLVIPMNEGINDYAIKVLNKLREDGVDADIYLESGKFKKKMTYADKNNIKYVIILGDDELDKDIVTVKNMQTGEQESKALAEFDF